VRCLGAHREDTGIDQRIAHQLVGRGRVEGVGIALMDDVVEFLPGAGEVSVAEVDLGHHGEAGLATDEVGLARPLDNGLDRAPVLDAGIGVDLEIEPVAGEMAGQEGPGEHRPEKAGGLERRREVDVPAWLDHPVRQDAKTIPILLRSHVLEVERRLVAFWLVSKSSADTLPTSRHR